MKIRKQGTNGKQKWTRLDKNEDETRNENKEKEKKRELGKCDKKGIAEINKKNRIQRE